MTSSTDPRSVISETVTDVAVVPGTGVSLPALRANPPVRETVVLWENVSIGPMEDAETYFEACEPCGLNHKRYRQFGAWYAFARRDAQGGSFQWDPDGMIQQIIALSRYVRPNAACTEYAARRFDRDFADPIIAPLPVADRFIAYEYRRPDERGWLDTADAYALAYLAQSFFENRPFPDRIRTAMWTSEYLVRVRFAHIHHILVVTALEALLKAGRKNTTSQFVERVVALANELNVEGVTKELALSAYRDRSGNVHGSQQRVSSLEDVMPLQDVLRATIKRAIEERDFCSRFESDVAIQTAWPMPR